MTQTHQPRFKVTQSRGDRQRLLDNDGILAVSTFNNHNSLSIQTTQDQHDANSFITSNVVSPTMGALDPITEQSFNMRKASLNLPAGRKAMQLYKAPVVQERYKRVISHFNKPKNSFNGQRLDPILIKKGDSVTSSVENTPYLASSKDGPMPIHPDE